MHTSWTVQYEIRNVPPPRLLSTRDGTNPPARNTHEEEPVIPESVYQPIMLAHLYVPTLPLCLVLTVLPAQVPTSQQPNPCPNRGVMRIAATSEGSDLGVSCSGGISFSFEGRIIAASESRCPSYVVFTPPHDVQDPSTHKPCTWWGSTGTTYDVTKQSYKCFTYLPFFGCGTFGFGQCCEPNGPPEVVNSFPNYAEAPCVPCNSGDGTG